MQATTASSAPTAPTATATAVRRTRHTPYAPAAAVGDDDRTSPRDGVLELQGGRHTMAVLPQDHAAASAYTRVMAGQLGYGISAAALSKLCADVAGEHPLALRNVPKRGHAQSGLWSLCVRDEHAAALFQMHRRVVFVSETMYRVFATEGEADAFVEAAKEESQATTRRAFGTTYRAVHGGPTVEGAAALKAPKRWAPRQVSVSAPKTEEPDHAAVPKEAQQEQL